MSEPRSETSKERSLQRYRVDFGYGRYYFEPNDSGDWVKYEDVAKLMRALTNAVRNVTIARKEWYTHIAQPLQDVYQALGAAPELALSAEEIAALAFSGDWSADVLRTDDDPLKPPAVETTSDEPTPHGVIYDRLGWLCSVCGGWNHARDKLCTHTHVTYEVGSVQETKPKPTIEGLERLLHIDYNVPGCDCLGCELAPKALAPRYELPLEWQAREWTEIDSPSSLCGLLGCNRQTPHHHKAAL